MIRECTGMFLVLMSWVVWLMWIVGTLWMCVSYATRLFPNWWGVAGGILLSPVIFEWLPIYALFKDGLIAAIITAGITWFLPMVSVGMSWKGQEMLLIARLLRERQTGSLQ